MHSYEKIDLGNYRGETYFLAGFTRPEPSRYDEFNPDEDADEYGVSLVRSGEAPIKDNTEIVRLDNAHGQIPHVDNVHFPPDSDEDEKTELGEDWDYSRMRGFLLSEWQSYVDLVEYYHEYGRLWRSR